MLGVEEVFIHKIDKNTGEASIKIIDTDNDDFGDLQIKKIQINMLDSSGAISVLKAQGVSIVSGKGFEFFSEVIVEAWEMIEEQDSGIYRITETKIIKEG